MSVLAGVNVTDASGNRLTDASAAYITDQDILATVDSAGIVHNANQASLGDLWQQFLDWLEDAEGFAEILALTPVIQNLSDRVDDLLLTMERFAYTSSGNTALGVASDHTYPMTTVNGIIAAMPTPEPGSGMTTEEHNKLFGLANVNYSQVGDAVWQYGIWTEDLMGAGQYLQAQQVLYNFWLAHLHTLGWVGIPLNDNPHWSLLVYTPETLGSTMSNWATASEFASVPHLDLSTAQAGDTVMSWLQREYPGYEYRNNLPDDTTNATGVYIVPGGTLTTYAYRCNITQLDIRVQTGEITPINVTVNTDQLPLWPGLANVTLGAPVALADNLTIATPMDGCIVTVTTPPTGTSHYRIGGHMLDYGSGRMTFGDDRGDLEQWQYLGFRTAIYTPRSMLRAASAHFQVVGGGQGTVTPWTRS